MKVAVVCSSEVGTESAELGLHESCSDVQYRG